MANSDFLRKNKNQHAVKNSISKMMDSDIDSAIRILLSKLSTKYPRITFQHQKKMHLTEIIKLLKQNNSHIKNELTTVLDESFIKPDGGFIFFVDKTGCKRIVLVAEVKHQGTNDKRLREGLMKQAKGNAIERLGKNLIGIRALFKNDDIIPFVCFGSGCDFDIGSSIVDRVKTMNEFFPLNQTIVKKKHRPFEPASMFFRLKDWTTDEMVPIMEKIVSVTLAHYKKSGLF